MPIPPKNYLPCNYSLTNINNTTTTSNFFICCHVRFIYTSFLLLYFVIAKKQCSAHKGDEGGVCVLCGGVNGGEGKIAIV